MRLGDDRRAEVLRREGAPYRWKKGQSGNPGGRRRNRITEAIREQLTVVIDKESGMTVAEAIANAVIREALSGKRQLQAANEIMDRTEGKPKPLENLGIGVAPDTMNREQLADRITSILKQAAQRRS